MLSSMLPLWGQGPDSRGALGNGVTHPLSFPTPGFLYSSTQPSLPEGCSRSVTSLKEPSASGEQNAGEQLEVRPRCQSCKDGISPLSEQAATASFVILIPAAQLWGDLL